MDWDPLDWDPVDLWSTERALSIYQGTRFGAPTWGWGACVVVGSLEMMQFGEFVGGIKARKK